MPINLTKAPFAGFVALLAVAAIPSLFAQTAITWSSTSDTTFSTGANWTGGVAPLDDLTSNNATFSGTGTANPTLSVSQSLQGLSFTGGAYAFSSTGGAGLTLGTGGISTTTGNHTVSADVALGAAQSWTPASGTQLTVSGVVSGGFALTQSGAGTLVLSGANTHSGGTTLSAGTFALNHASALGTRTLTVSGGTLDNTSGSALTISTNNAQTWTGSFTYTGTSDLNLGTGAVALTSGRTLTVSAGTLTVGGVISNGGSASFTKAGAGTLVLTGNNTYGSTNGLTTISAGTLQIGNGNAVSALTGNRIANSGSLVFNTSTTLTTGKTFVISGTGTVTLAGAGAVTYAGTHTYTGATIISAGTLSIGNGGTFGAIANTSITNNSALIFNRSDARTYAGVISGTGSVTKLGASSLTLSGVNTHTGTTTISAGSIILDATGTIANSSVINLGTTASPGTLNVTAKSSFSFGTGQTVSGVGTINLGAGKTVTINGTLAPGNSTGIITVTGDLVLDTNAVTNFEINGTTAGTGYDQINVSGTTTFGGLFNLSFGSTIANGSTLTLFGLTGGSTGAHFSSIVGTGSGYTESWANNSGVWTSTSAANSQLLTFTESTGSLSFAASAVPEPSTYAALFGAVAFAGVVIKRRKKISVA